MTEIKLEYRGDGNISKENGIELCTDAFDEKSMDILLQKLFDLDFLPRKTYNNRIIIPNKRVIEFLKYIGKSPVTCFNYKWDTFITHSYKNRICPNCNTIFDSEYNHQIYCSDKCASQYSYKHNFKLKELKKFI